MGSPEETRARLRQLLAEGKIGNPEVRARVEAAIGGPAPQPAPVAGPQVAHNAPAPPGVGVPPQGPIGLAKKVVDLSERPFDKATKSPTAYYPTEEKSDFPILYTEPPNTVDTEGAWKRGMADAEQRGQRVYRVKDEFPLTGDMPLAQRAQNALVRAGTDALIPFGFGADLSLTGGLASKGAMRGAEASGVVPEGTAADTARMVASSPNMQTAGAMAGALAPKGLAGLAGRGAAAATAPLMAKGALGKAAGYGLAGAAAGGGVAATNAAVGNAFGEDRDVATEAQLGAGLGAVSNLMFGSLGELGRNRSAALRDPLRNPAQAQDVNLLERAGGETSLLRGARAKAGTPFEGDVKALGAEARATAQPLDALAADKAGRALGEELGAYRSETLGRAGAANAEAHANTARVKGDVLVKKNLELIRKATHADGQELPGHAILSLGKEMSKLANLRVVDASDPLAHSADPEMVIPAGYAAKLGIIPRTTRGVGKVVVVEPKSFDTRELDDITRSYYERSTKGDYDPKQSPREMGELHKAALVNRTRFGSALEKMKAEQSAALEEMKNSLEAAGLQRESPVDMADVGTQSALYNSMRGYKTGASPPRDAVLDKVAGRSPALRSQMDRSTAVGALQRLKSQASPNPASMLGPRPYGALGAAKLRLDPIMGAFGAMGDAIPGLPYGASTEGARRLGKKGSQ